MAQAEINGISLYYEEHGAGVPVVMIAGLASDSQSWLPLIPHLSSHFHLVLPDNRAVGRTQPLDAETGIELMASDVVALLDELGIAKAHVVGHSMGGIVAMELAANHSERVDRLVVMCSGPVRTARNVSLIDTLVTSREAGLSDELWFKTFFYWLFSPSFFENGQAVDEAVRMAIDYPLRQPVEAMRKQTDAIARFESKSSNDRIRAPTLGLAGANDLMIPPEEMRAILADIENFRFDIVDAAAHSVHWEAPQAVADKILSFLNDPK